MNADMLYSFLYKTALVLYKLSKEMEVFDECVKMSLPCPIIRPNDVPKCDYHVL